MQFLFDIFPVLLFFIVFKLYGMYAATAVGIVSSFIQVALYRLIAKKWDNKQLITLAVFVVFGGMTLYFHNPIFVKWKPTIIFWLFAITIMFSHFFMQKPIAQRLVEGMMQGQQHIVPPRVWTILNLVWFTFFGVLGAINLYIAYHFSDNAWVNFKFYGITSALIALSVVQTLYLMRFMIEVKDQTDIKK